jgi:hypothetical protein
MAAPAAAVRLATPTKPPPRASPASPAPPSAAVAGATPQPDAVLSFRVATAVVAEAQLYLRYDGEVGSGTDNHALNVGLRLSW